MMNETRIIHLLQRYADAVLTREERTELIALLDNVQNTEIPDHLVQAMVAEAASLPAESLPGEAVEKFIRGIVAVDKPVAPAETPLVKSLPRIPAWRRWSWVAALAIVFGIGVYWYTINADRKKLPPVQLLSADEILPGKDRALLTLDDGSTIALDSASHGAIARQGTVNIIKTANGELRYEPAGATPGKTMINTVQTPRGGQFKIRLPDGTDVWLNAASAIRYPAAFTDTERVVRVTGEVYFEVAKYKQKPFVVIVDDKARIEVLGTHFNINAYSNAESLNTTLLEGQIKLLTLYNLAKSDIRGYLMKPGQQVQLSDKLNVIENADIARVMAWKNGLFDFTGTGFESVMKDVERWYDIEVQYEGPVPDMKFKGRMDRGVKLSGIVRFLEDYGLKTRLEGRTLIIAQ